MGGRGGAGLGNTAPVGAPNRIADAEALILSTFRANYRPGDWAGLAELRAELREKGFTTSEQDAALNNLRLYEPNVRITPVANTKGLKTKDIAAALEPSPGVVLHAFTIDPAYTYPKKLRPGGS